MRQGFEALFASHLCTRAAFGLEWQVDVLQCRQVPAVVNALLEFGSHLFLFRNGLDNGILALGNLLKSFVAVADGRNLHFIQSPRSFLTIARDERYGTSLGKELEGVFYAVFRQVQLG